MMIYVNPAKLIAFATTWGIELLKIIPDNRARNRTIEAIRKTGRNNDAEGNACQPRIITYPFSEKSIASAINTNPIFIQ